MKTMTRDCGEMEKNIIVTGASKGLGRAIALALTEGNDVGVIALIARDLDKLYETAEKIRQVNQRCNIEVIQGDLSHSHGIGLVIHRLQQLNLNYNLLINNAGYCHIGALERTPEDEIEKTFFTNLIAPMRLIKFFLPAARKCGWGRIINISSILIFNPNPLLTSYIVSKSALKSLSECISLADISHGITCNTICPGLMMTEMAKTSFQAFFPGYNERTARVIEDKFIQQLPSKKVTDLSEVTNLVNFLVSDNGGTISGEFFRVASGML